MMGYDSWKLASPYDDDAEWVEKREVTCYADMFEKAHDCNDACYPDEGTHVCEFAGTLEVQCVGEPDGDYTIYWTCPECGIETTEEVN